MTEEEKLNEMSGALATETIDEAPLRLPPQGGENAGDTPEHEPSTPQGEPEKGITEEKTAAEKELEDMTGRIGAEGILEMIRGNRNVIIDQLIAEAKEKQHRRPMPSGVSVSGKANSIFDIAALA